MNNVVYSTTGVCCSTLQDKLLDTERSVTSNTVSTGEINICHCSGLCLRTASCDLLWATVQKSVHRTSS